MLEGCPENHALFVLDIGKLDKYDRAIMIQKEAYDFCNDNLKTRFLTRLRLPNYMR